MAGARAARRSRCARWRLLAVVVRRSASRAGAPGWANDRWQEFKAPPGAVAAGGAGQRLQPPVGAPTATAATSTGSRRWTPTRPRRWKGIGPGTFEFWWARNGTTPGFIRDAHTLYFETLAETGIVGFALLGGLLAFLLGAAVVALAARAAGAAHLDRRGGRRPRRVPDVGRVRVGLGDGGDRVRRDAARRRHRRRARRRRARRGGAGRAAPRRSSRAPCWRCSPSWRSAPSPCRWRARWRRATAATPRPRARLAAALRGQPHGRSGCSPTRRRRACSGRSCSRRPARWTRAARGRAGRDRRRADELAHVVRARAHRRAPRRGRRGRWRAAQGPAASTPAPRCWRAPMSDATATSAPTSSPARPTSSSRSPSAWSASGRVPAAGVPRRAAPAAAGRRASRRPRAGAAARADRRLRGRGLAAAARGRGERRRRRAARRLTLRARARSARVAASRLELGAHPPQRARQDLLHVGEAQARRARRSPGRSGRRRSAAR